MLKCLKCRKEFDGNKHYTPGLSDYDPVGTYHCPHCDYIFDDSDIAKKEKEENEIRQT